MPLPPARTTRREWLRGSAVMAAAATALACPSPSFAPASVIGVGSRPGANERVRVDVVGMGPGHVARPHVENWLECIETRRTPNAPIATGHRSNSVCWLANIARELGRRLEWDPERERFRGDDEANALLDRPRRPEFELPAV